ncbi:MAG: hypothetical protein Q4C89_00640 [Deinococcus sp.]|uniref:hypothetical protein n=1 Tax=Deinococcus sp. TaxID=47478 RepID=UPI0026DC7AB8|nr:hypothetical protein [Deinococcus sp.]MDO4244516.1 hypothetical protein [Deinococcus sp.]
MFYLPVLVWWYLTAYSGPSFDTDEEVAHHLGDMLLSFLFLSGMAVLSTPLWWLVLNAVRRRKEG